MRKKILLLGDSIRMSYQAAVQERLATRFEVVGPEENCQYSLYTAGRVDDYLRDLGRPDIVHWNNGLHDLGCNLRRGPVQFAPADYLRNLEYTLQTLRAAGARIIWATTTPVDEAIPPGIPFWSWSNAAVREYNLIAGNLMRTNQIPINDLYGVVAGHPEYYSDDHLHLNERGRNACAQAVARAITELEAQHE